MSQQSGVSEGGEPPQLVPNKKSGRNKIPSPNNVYKAGSRISTKSNMTNKSGKGCTTPKPLISSKSNRILFPTEKDYISKITQSRSGRNTSGLVQTKQRGFVS